MVLDKKIIMYLNNYEETRFYLLKILRILKGYKNRLIIDSFLSIKNTNKKMTLIKS